MRTIRYRDERGNHGSATVEVRERRVVIDYGDERTDFDLDELRAAIETEAFTTGPVIAPGPGADVGRRSA